MRRAEWRRRADDPKRLIGWWWRGMLDAGWPVYAFTGLLWLAIFWGMPWLAMLGVGAALVANGLRTIRTPDHLRALLPDPAPEGQFRATAIYRRDGLKTGEDPMAFVVVDGWLIGEGLRSHFALRRDDVLHLRTGSDWKARLVLTDGSEIRLLGVFDPARVVLERWHARSVLPAGESTFPPMLVQSPQFARWAAWTIVGFILSAIPNGTKLWLHLSELLSAPFLVIGVGMILYGLRRLYRITKITGRAQRELAAILPEGSSAFIDIAGLRVEVRGEACAPPRASAPEKPPASGSTVPHPRPLDHSFRGAEGALLRNEGEHG